MYYWLVEIAWYPIIFGQEVRFVVIYRFYDDRHLYGPPLCLGETINGVKKEKPQRSSEADYISATAYPLRLSF